MGICQKLGNSSCNMDFSLRSELPYVADAAQGGGADHSDPVGCRGTLSSDFRVPRAEFEKNKRRIWSSCAGYRSRSVAKVSPKSDFSANT